MSSCLEPNTAAGATNAGRARIVAIAMTSLVLLAGALAGQGCAEPRQASGPLPAPMQIDAAMQRREWERSAAWYPNGDTVAGVNRFPIRSKGGSLANPDFGNALFDLGASMAQTVALPFTYLVVPPFARQVHTGEAIPPTYTAMPALAPPAREIAYGTEPTGQEEQLQQLQSPQPLPRPAPAGVQRRGPLGPGDSEFMSSPPTPEEPD